MRVRPGGSHHQKFVVLRHPGRPELDVAFVGGIDLCHSRRDDADHRGDPQRQPMAKVYGAAPALARRPARGPRARRSATSRRAFRERWDDPTPLTRNPLGLAAATGCGATTDRPTRCRRSCPTRRRAAPHAVQVLRTYPARRRGYPFAPGRRAQRRPRLRQGARAGPAG